MKSDGPVREGVAAEIIRPEFRERLAVQPIAFRPLEMIGKAFEEAEEVIEPAIHRLAGQMPFSDQRRAISAVVKFLGQQGRFLEMGKRLGPPVPC